MRRIMIRDRLAFLANIKADGALRAAKPDAVNGADVDVADGLRGVKGSERSTTMPQTELTELCVTHLR